MRSGETARIAAVVHLYYPERWPELASCLKACGRGFDLFVTYVNDDPVLDAVRTDFPDAHFIKASANRGFDIAPFLQVLDSIDVSAYDYVVKLHTKRDVVEPIPLFINGYDFDGPAWRNHLLRPFRSSESWRLVWESFERDREVKMVADAHVILKPRDTPWEVEREIMRLSKERAEKDFAFTLPRSPLFVAGTMFAARMEVFKPFLGKFRGGDFEASERDGTVQLAYQLERLFGFSACSGGGKIVSFDGSFAAVRRRAFVKRSVKAFLRFFYQDKTGRTGRRIIKVLKIPVYASRAKVVAA